MAWTLRRSRVNLVARSPWTNLGLLPVLNTNSLTCFCSVETKELSSLMPTTSLKVRAVPPQLPQLGALMNLEGAYESETRADTAMSSAFSASAGFLPPTLPTMSFGVGTAFELSARLIAVGKLFPLLDLEALKTQVEQSVSSLTAAIMPFSTNLRAFPDLKMSNMAMAAHMTLALRQKGVCPMEMSGVDASFSTSMGFSSSSALSASMNLAADLSMKPFPGFALSADEMKLACELAALAPLAEAEQPASSGWLPSFVMEMTASLESFPKVGLDPSMLMQDLNKLADLAAIKEAFGEDAMTPQGVARVNMMLDYVARLSLPPIPGPAINLEEKLKMVPDMEEVSAGASVLASMDTSMSASLGWRPTIPSILPLLEALIGMKTGLGGVLGLSANVNCPICKSGSSA